MCPLSILPITVSMKLLYLLISNKIYLLIKNEFSLDEFTKDEFTNLLFPSTAKSGDSASAPRVTRAVVEAVEKKGKSTETAEKSKPEPKKRGGRSQQRTAPSPSPSRAKRGKKEAEEAEVEEKLTPKQGKTVKKDEPKKAQKESPASKKKPVVAAEKTTPRSNSRQRAASARKIETPVKAKPQTATTPKVTPKTSPKPRSASKPKQAKKAEEKPSPQMKKTPPAKKSATKSSPKESKPARQSSRKSLRETKTHDDDVEPAGKIDEDQAVTDEIADKDKEEKADETEVQPGELMEMESSTAEEKEREILKEEPAVKSPGETPVEQKEGNTSAASDNADIEMSEEVTDIQSKDKEKIEKDDNVGMEQESAATALESETTPILDKEYLDDVGEKVDQPDSKEVVEELITEQPQASEEGVQELELEGKTESQETEATDTDNQKEEQGDIEESSQATLQEEHQAVGIAVEESPSPDIENSAEETLEQTDVPVDVDQEASVEPVVKDDITEEALVEPLVQEGIVQEAIIEPMVQSVTSQEPSVQDSADLLNEDAEKEVLAEVPAVQTEAISPPEVEMSSKDDDGAGVVQVLQEGTESLNEVQENNMLAEEQVTSQQSVESYKEAEGEHHNGSDHDSSPQGHKRKREEFDDVDELSSKRVRHSVEETQHVIHQNGDHEVVNEAEQPTLLQQAEYQDLSPPEVNLVEMEGMVVEEKVVEHMEVEQEPAVSDEQASIAEASIAGVISQEYVVINSEDVPSASSEEVLKSLPSHGISVAETSAVDSTKAATTADVSDTVSGSVDDNISSSVKQIETVFVPNESNEQISSTETFKNVTTDQVSEENKVFDILLNRQFIPNPDHPPVLNDVSRQFTVVSYNILADCHLKRSDYSFTQPQFLDIGYRHKRMMKELVYLNGDVVCMQEVGPEYYTGVLEPAMKR